MNTTTTQSLIARRAGKGFNEADCAALLADLLATCGRGTLATALHYQGFATVATAERIASRATGA